MPQLVVLRGPQPEFLEHVRESAPWDVIAAALPRPDLLPLLKGLLLQRWTGAPDEVFLRELDDRLSWRRFCGIEPLEPGPTTAMLAAFRMELNPELLEELAQRWLPPGDGIPLISIVSPVYRAAEIVAEFVRSVMVVLANMSSEYEIILVEDGSDDESWSRITAACASDSRIKGVKLSRNFGQHPAITAGLEHARGRWVVVMDCDLQDDPSFIPHLHAKACEGFDVVLTTRSERAHSWVKNTSARLFTGILNRLSGGQKADPLIGGYSLLSRRAVNAFLRIRDAHRHYLVLLRWLGFPAAHVPVVHRPRHYGRSSYGLIKLARHALDGWVSHSNRLLYASVALGSFFLLSAFAGALLVVILYFLHGFAQGWPSLVVLILVSTGSILISLGVLGIYVGKIFDQVRARPLYVIEETINVEPDPTPAE
ncbi:MAG: glycosyltransferase family 2 protein [Acidobacteriota bacterium]